MNIHALLFLADAGCTFSGCCGPLITGGTPSPVGGTASNTGGWASITGGSLSVTCGWASISWGSITGGWGSCVGASNTGGCGSCAGGAASKVGGVNTGGAILVSSSVFVANISLIGATSLAGVHSVMPSVQISVSGVINLINSSALNGPSLTPFFT